MSNPFRRISPFLWFNNQAEEAVQFYTSIFPNSSVTATTRYGDAGPGPKGSVMTIGFLLDGQPFTALNGGPQFKFTEAISFVVHCRNQEEVDHYWEKLSAGGEKVECGWLKDKFGVAWQVVPVALIDMLRDAGAETSERVMKALLQMKKLDIAGLEKAYRGR